MELYQPDRVAVLSRLQSWRRRANRFADAVDRKPLLVFGFLTVVYILVVFGIGGRPLWHDELYTFYIAHAPNLKAFFDEIRLLDMNPPLIYGSVRLANQWFGLSPFATRLPSIFAFYGAAIFLFLYLRGKTSTLWAAFGLLLFWSTQYILYSAEARPYALLLFFFSITLFSYDVYSRTSRDILPVLGILAGGVGMAASHVFAPFSLAPFFAAELLRVYRTRRVNFRVWAALLLPLALLGFYVPLVRNFQAVLFPLSFQASPKTLVRLYWRLLTWDPRGLLCAFLLALALTSPRSSEPGEGSRWTLYDFVIGGVLGIAIPAIITLLMMRTHGAFWERYCLTSCLATVIGGTGWIAWRFEFRRIAALGGVLVLAVAIVVTDFALPFLEARRHTPTARVLDNIRPDLPLVVGNGVSFLEMDNREPLALKSRIFYLEDRPSAIRYSHSTLFEGLETTTRYFPVQAHVDQFSNFVRKHHEFLVLSRLDWPENWILPKLRDDGAVIASLGHYDIPYSDQDLFLVTVK